MNASSHAGVRPGSTVQSAESFVAVALLSVCAAAGLAAGALSLLDRMSEAAPVAAPDAEGLDVPQDAILAAEEQAVLTQWQRRLDSEFSQRAQVQRQQEQETQMAMQAEALAAAQAAEADAKAAAEKAAIAVAAAEARARAAEAERQRALAQAEAVAANTPSAPASADAAAPARQPVRETASVDWSSCDRPSYPLASTRLNEQGVVMMSFELDALGQVVNGRVVDSSGARRLDNAALDAISKCRFHPETVDGKAQAATALVRFEWKLDG